MIWFRKSRIRGGLFSIICNEYTDISNKEQLITCIRWVDKELKAHEDFGFYNVFDIGAENLLSAIMNCPASARIISLFSTKPHFRNQFLSFSKSFHGNT